MMQRPKKKGVRGTKVLDSRQDSIVLGADSTEKGTLYIKEEARENERGGSLGGLKKKKKNC